MELKFHRLQVQFPNEKEPGFPEHFSNSFVPYFWLILFLIIHKCGDTDSSPFRGPQHLLFVSYYKESYPEIAGRGLPFSKRKPTTNLSFQGIPVRFENPYPFRSSTARFLNKVQPQIYITSEFPSANQSRKNSR